MKVSIIDSIKNWVIIVFFLAPKALRKPISRVLSVTVTNIMFIIPIPPTSKEMAAIPESRVVNVPAVEVAVAKISCWDIIEKSAAVGSLNLCLVNNK